MTFVWKYLFPRLEGSAIASPAAERGIDGASLREPSSRSKDRNDLGTNDGAEVMVEVVEGTQKRKAYYHTHVSL